MAGTIKVQLGFQIGAPAPIDSRSVVDTLVSLNVLPLPYDGLVVYVKLEDAYYRYLSGSWDLHVTLQDQTLVRSSLIGEPAGSIKLNNIVRISQADYDSGVKVATTLYIITNN